MKKYKIIFSFRNGVCGEVTLESPSDKIAFMTACQMFAAFDEYEWNINKIE